jgi:predicted enzyme related to lactoylglutathione lyase
MAKQRDVMRRTYPAGVPCWVDTGQPDVEAAMHFYGGVFGWEFQDTASAGRMGSGTGRYVIATLDGQEAAAISDHGSGTAAWNTYVSVDDADAAVRHLLAVGATLKSAPAGVRPGGIQAVLEDPEGIEFRIWQARERPGRTSAVACDVYRRRPGPYGRGC